MNWGALFLIIIGIGVVAIGITGSSKRVCQGLTGSTCDWFPGTGGATEGAVGGQVKSGNTVVSGGTQFSTVSSTTPTGGTQKVVPTDPAQLKIIDLLDQQLSNNKSLIAALQSSNFNWAGKM